MTSAEVVGQLVGAPGGQAAEVDPVAVEGVHPDPVAEQRAAALAPGRVDRDDRDPQLVLLVDAEPAHELVGEARLAGAAGAGDAEDRHLVAAGRRAQRGQRLGREAAALDAGDRPRDRDPVAADHVVGADLTAVPEVEVEVVDDAVDHPRQPEPLAVLGGEDRHPAAAQPLDLVVHDHPAAPADDVHVVGAAGPERLDEVLEVLDVAALVRRDRDALDVLLDGGVHDLLDRAVVAEVHDLAALAHEDPPHDVDRGVVPVEQAGRGDESHRVARDVELAHVCGPQLVGRPSNGTSSARATVVADAQPAWASDPHRPAAADGPAAGSGPAVVAGTAPGPQRARLGVVVAPGRGPRPADVSRRCRRRPCATRRAARSAPRAVRPTARAARRPRC